MALFLVSSWVEEVLDFLESIEGVERWWIDDSLVSEKTSPAKDVSLG